MGKLLELQPILSGEIRSKIHTGRRRDGRAVDEITNSWTDPNIANGADISPATSEHDYSVSLVAS